MRRTTAALIVAAFLTFTVAVNARASAPWAPDDVRNAADWSVVVSPAWPFANASTLCRGYRPSDLEAWNLAGERIGDALLTYVPSPLPGILPPVVVSRYAIDVRVWGWCG